jgi:hypothetical protein
VAAFCEALYVDPGQRGRGVEKLTKNLTFEKMAACGPELTQVLNSVISVLVPQETATWGGCDLGGDGFWEGDYGWGVRVRRHFSVRGMSSVRYGTRFGDLKENWFLLFSN